MQTAQLTNKITSTASLLDDPPSLHELPVAGALDGLARLPAQAILDSTALAQALGVSARTIPRWVGRGQLPPGVKLGSKNVWMAGQVLNYFAIKLEDAEKSADRRHAAQRRANEGLTT